MAAGLVYSNYTTSSGVTFTVARWVPDTSTPLVNGIGVHTLVKPDGTPIDFGLGVGGAGTVRVSVGTDQMAALTTTYDALNNAGVGGQKVYQPTDQPVPNKVQVQTSGMTRTRVVAGASTNATTLKASAGNIFDIALFNVAAYDIFFKFYDKASNPTVGTDTPVWTIPIKAGTGYADKFPYGEWFPTGIAYAITKLQADADTTVLVAGDVTGRIKWI